MGEHAVRAYIGLGSNLGDSIALLKSALMALNGISATRCVAHSSFYSSEPLGDVPQNNYINAVAALDTALPAQELLVRLQAIESDHGRIRGAVRWGPRTVDLDLLLYGSAHIKNDLLTVPHPGIMEREFVLYPLYEIAPELDIPGSGRLQTLVEACPRRGLQRLDKRV